MAHLIISWISYRSFNMKCVCFEFEIILMNLVVFQENNKTTRARMDSTSELNKLVPDVWYWWVSPTFFFFKKKE
jgi:hypothetical protein